METDLIAVRRWLWQDFQVRAEALVARILSDHPMYDAFEVMSAVETSEAMRPLKPEAKAYILDLYIQAKWNQPSAGDPGSVRTRSRRRRAVYRR